MIKFAEKAGMAGIDKERISKIIEENTNANYSAYSQKRQEKTKEQIQANEERLKKATAEQREAARREMEIYKQECEASRDLSRVAVHVDMDAFFAAVECRDDPALRTIPMAVGSTSMLSTSNYVARRFGVRAAMPGFIAKKLCPELKIVAPNFRKYKEASAMVQDVFRYFDPDMSMGSLDEAYLDLTEHVKNRRPITLLRSRYAGKCICRLPRMEEESAKASNEPPAKKAKTDEPDRHGTQESRREEKCSKCGRMMTVIDDFVEFGPGRAEAVRELRFRVEQLTGLTCSAGIAPNHKLAKVCSDMNKPNGQFELANNRDAVLEFLKNLPIRKICGIGRVSEEQLRALGIDFCSQLAERSTDLTLVFKPRTAQWFVRVGLGVQSPHSEEEEDDKRKSISQERTFSPTADPEILRAETVQNCQDLVELLPRKGIAGARSVTLKIKWATFDVITRCKSLEKPIYKLDDLVFYATKLLNTEMNGQPMRLIGVKLARLVWNGDDLVDGTRKQKSLSQFLTKPPTSSIPASIQEEKKDEGDDDDVDFIEDSDPEEQPQRKRRSNLTKLMDSFKKSRILGESKAPVVEVAAVEEEPQPGPSGLNNMVEEEPQPGPSRVAEEGHVACPICGKELENDERVVNRHVDECLNEVAIKELNPQPAPPRPRPSPTINRQDKNKKKKPAVDLTTGMPKPTTIPGFFHLQKAKIRERYQAPRTEYDKFIIPVRFPLPKGVLDDPETGERVLLHNPYDVERWREPKRFKPRDPPLPPEL